MERGKASPWSDFLNMILPENKDFLDLFENYVRAVIPIDLDEALQRRGTTEVDASKLCNRNYDIGLNIKGLLDN